MCGIYGFHGKPNKQTSAIVETLGLLNMSRGTDSSGLAFIADNDAIVYKHAVDSELFYKENRVIELLCQYRRKDFISILGHTRYATRGAVTPENAHPFIESDYVFTHNGVINNFDELNNLFKSDYQVDSQIIGKLLAERKDFKEAFNELKGYWTIPYVDMKESDSLKVSIHNNIFAFAYKGNQLYYSSEMQHLKQALHGERGFQFCKSGDNVVYSFYSTGLGMAIAKDKIQPKSSYTGYESYYSYGYDKPKEAKTHKSGFYTYNSDKKDLDYHEYEEDIAEYYRNKDKALKQEATEELKAVQEFEQEQKLLVSCIVKPTDKQVQTINSKDAKNTTAKELKKLFQDKYKRNKKRLLKYNYLLAR